MALDIAAFRSQFPEFTDRVLFPDATAQMYLGLAETLIQERRWPDTMIDYGRALFVAHHLAITARDMKATAMGGAGGTVQGILASKAIDRVSAAYDTGSVSLTDQGYWGATSYGIRLLQMARMVGVGGVQL